MKVTSQLVFNDKPAVLRVMYDALMTVPSERRRAVNSLITFEAMQDWARDALVVGCRVGGEIAGGMLFKGREVHLGIDPRFSGRWLRHFNPMLDAGFAVCGPSLTARVASDNEKAVRFVEGVGAERLQEVDMYTEYAVTKGRIRRVFY